MLKGKSNLKLGLSEEMIAREMDLKSQINFLEQTIYKSDITKSVQSDNKDETEAQRLIEVKADFTELLNEMRIKHPHYYSIMYGENLGNGAEYSEQLIYQKKRLEDHLIIDYFESDDKIYAQYVKGDKSGVLSVNNNLEFKSAVARFKECLNKKAEIDYQKEAYFIYQQILEPILKSVQTKNIIVIPDGILSYFPFDLLVDEVLEQRTNYANFQYLLRRYNITYQHAGSLVKERIKRTKFNENLVLAFAPEFKAHDFKTAELNENTRSAILELASLPYARKEVEHISTMFKGQFLYEGNASETNFKKLAKDADIIHLATHSIINDQNPMMSQLIFSGDNENDGFLHTFELFDLQLSADLVCISACNSGFGELQKGEGMVSLARGFLYANAKNILMSLWSVPDQSSNNLMNYFYEEVRNDVSYEHAIRNAKLKYLEAADNNLSHPYYWGAFVYVGDVENEKSNWFLWTGLVVFILTLLLLSMKVLTPSAKRTARIH